MKITAFVSLAVALLAFTDAAAINRRPKPNPNGHSVALTRNENYIHNTHAQIAKLNRRYPGLNILMKAENDKHAHARGGKAGKGHKHTTSTAATSAAVTPTTAAAITTTAAGTNSTISATASPTATTATGCCTCTGTCTCTCGGTTSAAVSVATSTALVSATTTALVSATTTAAAAASTTAAATTSTTAAGNGTTTAAATTGSVALTNVKPDIEYFGTVAIGTPPQNVKLGSSDIWFPSAACTTAACKNHAQFNSATSTTFQKDGRPWSITYGDGSTASGILGTDMVNVGGVAVKQTIGLATAESAQFGSSPSDGLFGLGFDTIESVAGVKTFMDNAIAGGVLAQPVISVFLPSVRRNGGVGGAYLFGAIDNTKFTGQLTYVPVTRKGYWQIDVEDAGFNNQSLQQTSQGIIDTGTTLVIVSDAAAQAIHGNIQGAVNDPNNGWLVPCAVQNSTDNVSFTMGGTAFNVPVADLAFESLGDGSGNCFSGVQGGQNGLWILGDVFIKNNYCVFDMGKSAVGIAPLSY
ncbi:hypothetical protein BGZ58_008214 [Dissophora ornata]|nr:hypothetical protein BGZ58_008214 [Dissophora ornata]